MFNFNMLPNSFPNWLYYPIALLKQDNTEKDKYCGIELIEEVDWWLPGAGCEG